MSKKLLSRATYQESPEMCPAVTDDDEVSRWGLRVSLRSEMQETEVRITLMLN